MKFVKFGQGRKPFVIISGMSMAGVEEMADAVRAQYASLTDDYTIYFFDRAERLPDNCSISQMAADIAQEMRKVGLSKATIFGNSQGGMIAQQIAIDYPELVRALILASTYCYPTEVGKETFTKWSSLADANDGRALYRDFFERAYEHPNMELLKLIEDTATEEQCRKFGIEARANLSFDIRDKMDKIKCPTLAIGAEHDRVLGVEGTEEIARILGCDKYIYSDQAHCVCDEAPDFIELFQSWETQLP